MGCCGEPRDAPPKQQSLNEKSLVQPPPPQNNGFPQQQPQGQPPMGMYAPSQMPQIPGPVAMGAAPYGPNGSPPPNNGVDAFGQMQMQPTGPSSWNNTPTLNGNGSSNGGMNTGNGSYTPLLDPSIIRPDPVHATGSSHPASIRSSAFSPGPISPQFSGPSTNNPMFPGPGGGNGNGNPGFQVHMQQIPSAQTQQHQAAAAPSDEGRMSVSLDFGTTFSGISYGSSRIASGTVQQILSWPGASENFRKIPTCLLYDETGRVVAWGLEAKNASPTPGTMRCEWFKLFLEPTALRDESAVDPRLPKLPPGKRAIDLIIDFLSCLWQYAREQITREIGAVADLNAADVWLTVPAAWDAKGCQIMRDAAIQAELVSAAYAGDSNWRERLHIITEPEAAAVHCAHLTNLHQLRPSQNFMICDAGGGTVDLAVYKIIGSLQNLEIAEVCARSGSNCGSLFLDLRFRELVRTLLADHPVHLDPASLAYFMHAFSETDKLAYQGESDDANMFHFTCFNVEDPDDPSVGLVNGELAIPGYLLRREVFDPVVEQVLNLIEEQTRRVDQRIDALLLVGGFSGSEYLFKRVDETFSSRIKVIARPADADTATCRGAAQYGLARRPLVSSVIAPKSYIMRVKLPADQEDWTRRPAYIRENNAGVNICENRLQYLVSKGAILRKGQRVRTKFCKFSATPQDRLFVAVLYTSDSDKLMRYTDEGETIELCRWTVDLGTLPSFQQHANNPQPGGFYTDFELGLELDSAEVRGVLLYNGYECGRVTFDFLL